MQHSRLLHLMPCRRAWVSMPSGCQLLCLHPACLFMHFNMQQRHLCRVSAASVAPLAEAARRRCPQPLQPIISCHALRRVPSVPCTSMDYCHKQLLYQPTFAICPKIQHAFHEFNLLRAQPMFMSCQELKVCLYVCATLWHALGKADTCESVHV